MNSIVLLKNSITTSNISLISNVLKYSISGSLVYGGNRYYSNKSNHYNRRNSYTHQRDVKTTKKRELKKEAVQRGEELPIFKHTKQDHEHSKPLSHEDRVELKKKTKKKLKKEIKLHNEERLKHIRLANELELDQLTQEQKEKLRSFNLENDDDVEQYTGTTTSQQKVYYSDFSGGDPSDDWEYNQDDDDLMASEYDQDELEQIEEQFNNRYEDLPEIDLSKIPKANIIEIDESYLASLPKDQDGSVVLPEFISLKDAKSKFKFSQKDLDSIKGSYQSRKQKQIEMGEDNEEEVEENDFVVDEDHQQEVKEIQKLQSILDKRKAKLLAKQEKFIAKQQTKKGFAGRPLEQEPVVQEEKPKATKKKSTKKSKADEVATVEQVSTNVKSEEQQMVEAIQREHLQRVSKGRKMDLSPVTIDQVMEVLSETKLDDFAVFNVAQKCGWAEYLVLASSDSERLLATAEEDIIKAFKNRFYNLSSNPQNSEEWKCIDLKTVVIHLMETNTRARYDLETLWSTRRERGSTEMSWDDEKTSKLGEAD
ncbi:hypothetical protein DLAC_02790 [Tieghemostelium lacteum]|uniref:Ribosomal silencing factor RsfS n=1 Tax=Tieghemostelium lacteum TaxID=361077 RepID=A0A152A3S0_TIELA|nr:hypothetical protein DLAC_02790 [Tieghemostelium lacteum]|eukprot:KYR00747.1 hypothetical protein DLAC_02790 [Tieghemostelium lacteum]